MCTEITEINTHHYEVEHSKNGVRFEKTGSVIATQKGSYSFVHNNPVNGKNHYRLKIVDKDGRFVYSPVRVMELINIGLVKVYPNPVKELLYVSFGSPIHIRVVNNIGQQVWQQNSDGTATIKTSNWAAGIYLVEIDDGATVKTFKIHKQ